MRYRQYLATGKLCKEILEDWQWLISEQLQLFLVTKCGDAFLMDPEDGSVHWLDTIGGSVTQVASSVTEFESAADTPEKLREWFMSETVDSLALLGIVPQDGQCLSFKHPPVLGGQLDPDNFEVTDMIVHFSIAGQIHQQVKDLPPGASIDIKAINIDGSRNQAAATRPWWKFW